MELLSAGQPDSESELGASHISKQKPKMTTTAEKFTTTRPNSVLNKCALFPVKPRCNTQVTQCMEHQYIQDLIRYAVQINCDTQ